MVAERFLRSKLRRASAPAREARADVRNRRDGRVEAPGRGSLEARERGGEIGRHVASKEVVRRTCCEECEVVREVEVDAGKEEAEREVHDDHCVRKAGSDGQHSPHHIEAKVGGEQVAQRAARTSTQNGDRPDSRQGNTLTD